ncbi:aldehyde dehydrogenase family protein [Streptomyces sp. NPDC017435]|uniref:aldehyde dehydrogenase family protein n=1 Tax=Streptomyces sp. NPDC017435 TaxID=3364995 RepID=UPI0037B5A1C5
MLPEIILSRSKIKKDRRKPSATWIAAKALVTGDPRNPGTQVGSVVNRRSLAHLRALLDDAVERGAVIAAGGGFDGNGIEALTHGYNLGFLVSALACLVGAAISVLFLPGGGSSDPAVPLP